MQRLLGPGDGGLPRAAVELCRTLLRVFGLLNPDVRFTVWLHARLHDADMLCPVVQPAGILCPELCRLLDAILRLRRSGLRLLRVVPS